LAKAKGSPKTGGRQTGTQNKITTTVKDNVIATFERLGGVDGLVEWAEENRTEFYRLYSKLLPIETQVTGAITIVQKVYQ
jgi:UV DNA damage repair endonuclease